YIIHFNFDGETHPVKLNWRLDVNKWKPSIHMPRKKCRLLLDVLGVRIERLHDISEECALNEGVKPFFENGEIVGYENYMPVGYRWFKTAKESYQSLWEKINGLGSWDENPFVWVISYSICR
ncbi:MAG: hypothetical protein ACRC1D_00770, partial [Culicoidibacterales bacterium]